MINGNQMRKKCASMKTSVCFVLVAFNMAYALIPFKSHLKTIKNISHKFILKHTLCRDNKALDTFRQY